MSQYLIVSISETPYAFELSNVVEVLNSAKIVPIPGSGPEVVGYAKVREEIMPLLNGNLIYANEAAYGGLWVVLEKDGKKLAITVSTASDLVEAALEQVQGREDFFVRSSATDIVAVADVGMLFNKCYSSAKADFEM